ncbi:pyridoxal kinase [Parvibaculum sedimenti]|uniref:pyridoxal kinase n=1 Tax=Parvibaculum sedimenti TaxID=2608632 RepID=A0A6N6VQY9_9HYPH|nr:pyridoxal kinase [Parvibaculum sedimenti]KAB7742221.1 pyridoxal kinase [Parvibaculum sedimenti]
MATILSISSQVVYGAVGNTASAFAMERLGHEVWEVPTTLLAHHPGYGKPEGVKLAPDLIVGLIRSLDERGWLTRCDAVFSGYLAEADQADAVAEAVDRVKAANPDALYLCDPIVGDGTEPYVSREVETAQAVLARSADIVTPNWFEFCRLAGETPADIRAAIPLARKLGPKLVVITSAPAPEGRVSSVAVEAKRAYRAETAFHGEANGKAMPKGTGDLFAAVFLARLLNGINTPQALARAAASTAALVKSSVEAGRAELALAHDQAMLSEPGLLPNIEIIG